MKKSLSIVILICLACLCLAFPAFSAAAEKNAAIPAERQLARLVDEADLLSSAEEAELLAQLDTVSEQHNCDVAVVTVDSLEGKSAQSYADDFYDYNGYGMGDGDSGILLLFSMEERDWALSTNGWGAAAFTGAGQKYIMEDVLPDLSDGHIAAAFSSFAGLCDEFLVQAETGEPYDNNNLPKTAGSVVFNLLLSLLVGAVIAAVIMLIMRSSHKTVIRQNYADSYMLSAPNITGGQEMYLYKSLNRVAIPKQSSSSGGGSSMHTSSSGRSHGGSSGKF